LSGIFCVYQIQIKNDYAANLVDLLKTFCMVEFKNALKAIKPTQSAAIDQLFSSYGY